MPVADVRVGPDDDVAAGLVQALPQRFALALEGAVLRKQLLVDDDARAFGRRDLPRPVGRVGVDDQQFVDELVALHQLASRPRDDRADRLFLVERGQHQADRQALLALETDQSIEVAELAVVKVRFAEPALDSLRNRPCLLGRPFDRRQRLGLLLEPVEGRLVDRLARLDDDHRRLGSRRDRLRQRPEERGSTPAPGRRRGRAHHHHVGLVRLTNDRVADVRGLAHRLLDVAVGMLSNEVGQGTLGLRPDPLRRPRRDQMQGDDGALVAMGQGVGEAKSQLGVRAAADRHENAPNL